MAAAVSRWRESVKRTVVPVLSAGECDCFARAQRLRATLPRDQIFSIAAIFSSLGLACAAMRYPQLLPSMRLMTSLPLPGAIFASLP